MRTGKIIIVEDHEMVLKTLRVIFSREFTTLLGVQVPTLLPALLREDDVDVVLLDINFGAGKKTGDEGLFWLNRIRELNHSAEVVMITAFGDIELAVDALKKGATDFILKPWENDKLVSTVVAAWENRQKKKKQAISPPIMNEKSGQTGSDEADIAKHLIDFFLKKYAVAYGKPFPCLNDEARDKLLNQLLTGNISIVEQSIERTLLLHDSMQLTADDFIFDEAQFAASTTQSLDDIEKQFIQTVLTEKKGNLTLTAQQLRITRQTLYNKLKKHGL